jgi:hypothetical protein
MSISRRAGQKGTMSISAMSSSGISEQSLSFAHILAEAIYSTGQYLTFVQRMGHPPPWY